MRTPGKSIMPLLVEVENLINNYIVSKSEIDQLKAKLASQEILISSLMSRITTLENSRPSIFNPGIYPTTPVNPVYPIWTSGGVLHDGSNIKYSFSVE